MQQQIEASSFCCSLRRLVAALRLASLRSAAVLLYAQWISLGGAHPCNESSETAWTGRFAAAGYEALDFLIEMACPQVSNRTQGDANWLEQRELRAERSVTFRGIQRRVLHCSVDRMNELAQRYHENKAKIDNLRVAAFGSAEAGAKVIGFFKIIC